MSGGVATTTWDVIGHQDVVENLARAAASGSVSHAYLITGPEGVGRTTLALEFARALNCLRPVEERPCGVCDSCRRVTEERESWSHPDILLADLEWQTQEFGGATANRSRARIEFSIEAIRYLRRHITTRPILGRWKVQIVDDAERMSAVAPDAFLKTLEEPPSYAVLILIANSPDAIPETIRSRCRQISLGMVPTDDIRAGLVNRGVAEPDAETRARAARGRVARALDPDSHSDSSESAETGEVLAQALEHVVDPVARLELLGPIARDHTSKRDQTFALLNAHLSLWRDVLLIGMGLDEQVTSSDQEVVARLRSSASKLSIDEIHRAIWATQRCLADLDRSFQARIALQAMVMQWP